MIGGSRKTMDFIVLLYSVKSPLSMEYNATSVSKIPNTNWPNCKIIEYFVKMHYFPLDPSILTVKILCNYRS